MLKDQIREPEEAAERVLGAVERLREDQRGREIVW